MTFSADGIHSAIAGFSAGLAGRAGNHSNAVLTYEVVEVNTGFTTDAFGNPVPAPASKTRRIITARLYTVTRKAESGGETQRTPNLGTDERTVELAGVLVSPRTLPEPLPNIVEARVNGRVGRWVWADRYEGPVARATATGGMLGQQIQGFFQVRDGD
jgi:hypothetical protein